MKSTHYPPKLPLRLFRFYCSDERIEELEGDLYEVYNEFIEEKGKRFASLFYWWLVVRSFRSYAFKKEKMKKKGSIFNLFTHIRHNLVIAWRNLSKSKSITAINVLGLSIGVGAFLAILSIVHYEMSFNRNIPESDQMYRIYTSYTGSFTSTNKGVSVSVGEYVPENFSGLKSATHFQTYSAKVEVPETDGAIKDLDRQSQLIIAGTSYFRVVDQYEWLAGNPDVALDEPFKVVLTAEQATKYFGNSDWHELLDREIIYSDSLRVFVSGIVAQPDYNTDFEFTDFISYETLENSWLKDRFGGDWGSTNSSSQLWLKTEEGVDKVNLLMQLEALDKHVAEQRGEADWVQKYELQALEDVHFSPEIGIFDSYRSPAHADTLTILGVIAFAILLIAIFNFVNLETAQSTSKSKEVGVRKVLGSPKSQLVARFLTESTIISLFAVLIAIPIAHYSFIYFEEFVPEGVALAYENPLFWVTIVGLALLVGLLAGIYPSWVISSFKPVKALTPGASAMNPGGSLIRKSLILFQFLFSQLLIVGTLAIAWQISFMLDKELGFKEDGIIYFYTPYFADYSKQKLIMDEIETMPEITDYALQQTPPVQRGYSTSTVKYQSEKGEVVTSAHQKNGDTTWIRFYDIELLAGRNLLPNDTLPELLINERFMRDLGFDDPREAVGAVFEFNNKNHTAVGVIEDFHFRSLHHVIEPMIYKYEDKPRCISMKVPGDKLEYVINKLTDTYTEIYPERPFTAYFMDETIEQFYQTERRTSKLASVATGIAILISCLGLFGLISFTIVQKSKELGIRKVLGASLVHIGTILSKEFIILIVVAFVVSTPISWYIITKWMEEFAYKTDISWWLFVLGGLISILIAMASISVKVWKASGANPIESLRYE